jgi:hypothetical protein
MLAFSVLMITTDGPSKSDTDPLDFRQLVAQLASPNEAPKTSYRKGPHVKFPARYDHDAQ